MLYVYKQCETPIHAWSMSRVGGPNNIAPQLPERYLVLWTVEAVKRDGLWHYVFEFDTRASLEMNPLAALVSGRGEPGRYRDGADWRRWLGDGWRIIDEHARWELLQPSDDFEGAICDVRALPAWDPLCRQPALTHEPLPLRLPLHAAASAPA